MSVVGKIQAPFEQDWEFSQADFQKIAHLAKECFGLELSETKRSLIYSRLAKRMKALQLKDFAEYLDRLNGPHSEEERGKLLSVLTTNITQFFREDHHFETLRTDVLPELIRRARAGGRVRLWSAGCSTGQEPYSIAMIVAQEFPEAADCDFKILATDIDPVVVEKAASGKYNEAEINGLPADLHRKFVAPSPQDSDIFVIDPKIQKLVTFRVLNLIEPLPVSGPFDAIFCRNVTIYFDKETQGKVWGQLCEVLETGGHMFIGHSERMSGPLEPRMQKQGFTTFRKE